MSWGRDDLKRPWLAMMLGLMACSIGSGSSKSCTPSAGGLDFSGPPCQTDDDCVGAGAGCLTSSECYGRGACVLDGGYCKPGPELPTPRDAAAEPVSPCNVLVCDEGRLRPVTAADGEPCMSLLGIAGTCAAGVCLELEAGPADAGLDVAADAAATDDAAADAGDAD